MYLIIKSAFFFPLVLTPLLCNHCFSSTTFSDLTGFLFGHSSLKQKDLDNYGNIILLINAHPSKTDSIQNYTKLKRRAYILNAFLYRIKLLDGSLLTYLLQFVQPSTLELDLRNIQHEINNSDVASISIESVLLSIEQFRGYTVKQ